MSAGPGMGEVDRAEKVADQVQVAGDVEVMGEVADQGVGEVAEEFEGLARIALQAFPGCYDFRSAAQVHTVDGSESPEEFQ
ncbi:hypothetical protein GCM10010372_81410 [Streptomyces tauricus]|nr:hypothetical protein GCM10010372_81410 [Streptomyces tauricus]